MDQAEDLIGDSFDEVQKRQAQVERQKQEAKAAAE